MKKISTPVAIGRAYTFTEVLAQMQQKAAAEEAKFNAMTPDEQEAYVAQREKDHKEAMDLFAQAGGGMVLGAQGARFVKGK